ncbi:MarR family transcriptional regulator [Dactylosporangium sp. NPDC051485]|uniref:MarR family winged helix-turn-helix transcriptional regulator n=1 Tax=Dactylosporangium sp. NPDC051485 TaxID=3154846 RepID=UPI00344AB1FD
MTRWLDEEEQVTWRAFYGAATLLIDRLDRELQHDAGMPHAYYEILVVLSESPERSLRMSELALQTRSSRSRLSHAVTKLEARGWVRRRDCDDDKRGQFADLTEQGFAALEAAAPGHVETVRTHLFDPLTLEQLDQLRQISQAITGTLKK